MLSTPQTHLGKILLVIAIFMAVLPHALCKTEEEQSNSFDKIFGIKDDIIDVKMDVREFIKKFIISFLQTLQKQNRSNVTRHQFQREPSVKIRRKPRTEDKAIKEFIKEMSGEEKSKFEVYAINSGCSVQFSTSYRSQFQNFRLDHDRIETYNSWMAKTGNFGEWIQVSCGQPKYWTDVILQGRGDYDSWVTSVSLKYSLNGNTFHDIGRGATFAANSNRNQKVRITLPEPVYARTIRIYPVTFYNYMCLRFDALYLDIE